MFPHHASRAAPPALWQRVNAILLETLVIGGLAVSAIAAAFYDIGKMLGAF